MIGIGAVLTAVFGFVSRTGIWKDILELVLNYRVMKDQAALDAKRVEGDVKRAESNAQAELHKEFGQEFSYQAIDRSWWDALWDGVNRMPRPMMTFGTIAFFVWCARSPESFSESMRALQLMPEMGWYVFLTIVAFWFGGKLLDGVKPPAPRPSGKPAPAGKAGPTPPPTAPGTRTGRPSLDAWRASQRNTG